MKYLKEFEREKYLTKKIRAANQLIADERTRKYREENPIFYNPNNPNKYNEGDFVEIKPMAQADFDFRDTSKIHFFHDIGKIINAHAGAYTWPQYVIHIISPNDYKIIQKTIAEKDIIGLCNSLENIKEFNFFYDINKYNI